MATRKRNEDERLDDVHMDRVIAGLAQDKPMTKKDCCAILGIAYNVTRLATLIEKYKVGKIKDAERRASLRGKPATMEETTFIIQEYLEGGTIDAISKSTYRPSGFIKSVLERHSVPLRASSQDYFKPNLIPDGAVRVRFTVGEKVYSARYDSMAIIETERWTDAYGWVYRIWLLSEKWMQYANQEACELASLQHLRDIGVRV